jgi:RNA polymerase sigma-70 factor (ECF subfamily)
MDRRAKSVRRSLSTSRLLRRARQGDAQAASTLFRRHGLWLRQWARGRLPQWARVIHDTADVVQDALLHTFRRLDRFEDRGKGALRAYLCRAVDNRIRDVMRSVARRPVDALDESAFDLATPAPSPYDDAAIAERERRYKRALEALTDEERQLVVGRLELGYNYEQVALVAGRPSAEAARQAVRRAVTKLAGEMAALQAAGSLPS